MIDETKGNENLRIDYRRAIFCFLAFDLLILISSYRSRAADDFFRNFSDSNLQVDIGSCLVGNSIKGNVRLLNDSGVDLEIVDIKSSCGCMVSSVSDTEFLSNKQIDVPFTIKPDAGPFGRALKITTKSAEAVDSATFEVKDVVVVGVGRPPVVVDQGVLRVPKHSTFPLKLSTSLRFDQEVLIDVSQSKWSCPPECRDVQLEALDEKNGRFSLVLESMPASGFICALEFRAKVISPSQSDRGVDGHDSEIKALASVYVSAESDRITPSSISLIKSTDTESTTGWGSSFLLFSSESIDGKKLRIGFLDRNSKAIRFVPSEKLRLSFRKAGVSRTFVNFFITDLDVPYNEITEMVVEVDGKSQFEVKCSFQTRNKE